MSTSTSLRQARSGRRCRLMRRNVLPGVDIGTGGPFPCSFSETPKPAAPCLVRRAFGSFRRSTRRLRSPATISEIQIFDGSAHSASSVLLCPRVSEFGTEQQDLCRVVDPD